MIDLIAGALDVGWLKTLLMDFSLIGHLQPMTKGLIDSVDVVWCVGMSGMFLWLCHLALEAKRWR